MSYLARAITKWNKACDKRLAKLTCYIHFTGGYRQHWHVGNTAPECGPRLSQDADFAGDLADSKSTSRCVLCILGRSRSFQEAGSCYLQLHRSRDIPLDTGQRLEGILALMLWHRVIDALEPPAGRDPVHNIKPKKTKSIMTDKSITDTTGICFSKRTHFQPTGIVK